MIHRTLLIGRWIIDFLFAVDKVDIDGVLGCLYDSYAPEYIVRQAEEIMESCPLNCAFTYTNPKKKRGVVLIQPTSSGEEFLDSFVHEMLHLADNIAESIGARLGGEYPAYVAGDSARELAGVVCKLGCDCYRKDKHLH